MRPVLVSHRHKVDHKQMDTASKSYLITFMKEGFCFSFGKLIKIELDQLDSVRYSKFVVCELVCVCVWVDAGTTVHIDSRIVVIVKL